jgi:hypothetical protein
MGTAMIGADAVRHLLSAEQTRRLDNGALGMHPLGLDRVAPRTLHRQVADQDAHTAALLLDLSIVSPNPGAYGFTHMPGGVLPDQRPHRDAQRRQLGTAPVQELGGDGAEGSDSDEAQPDRFRVSDPAQQETIAGEGLGVGIGCGDRLFHQAQRLVCPTVQLGLGQPTPPHLVHTSSAKPSAQSGCAWASAIRRSRRLLFGRMLDRGW